MAEEVKTPTQEVKSEEKKTTRTRKTTSTTKKATTAKKVTKKAEEKVEKAVEEKPVEEKVEKVVDKKASKKAEKEAKKVEKANQKAQKKAEKEKAKQPQELPNPVSEARAVAKNIRCTPRKARLVLDLVRGKDVKDAVAILKNLNKAAAMPVLKVINSATANAVNNFNLDDEKLYIKEIYATDGMRMKRYLPRAKGSASGLIKRMCHITCVVKER